MAAGCCGFGAAVLAAGMSLLTAPRNVTVREFTRFSKKQSQEINELIMQ